MNNVTRIFVGNIPYDFEDQDLINTLQMAGPVENLEIKLDENTGKPKGFGFCTYKDPESRSSALRNLKHIDYNGRQLRINEAENDKGISFDDETIRSVKDVFYIKNSNNEKQSVDNIFESLNTEQKKIIMFALKELSSDRSKFKELLLNQSEDFLNNLLELQNSMLKTNTNHN